MHSMSRQKMVVLLAAVIGLWAVGSISQAAVNGARTGSITGKVVDSQGHAVAGAMVRLIKIPRNVSRHKPLGRVIKDLQPGQTIWAITGITRTADWAITGITRTADDGTFTVNNAPAGRYRILTMLRGVGRGRLRKVIHVSSGESTDVGTIVLHSGRRGKH